MGKGGKGKGGNRGKGKGKGGYKRSAPKGPQVDEKVSHSGTVKNYNKLAGYGFITLDKKVENMEGLEVFCHWKSIVSDDSFPFLHKDLKVELKLKNSYDDKGPRAWNVSLPGGASVNLQTENDAKNKEFVGAQTTRYSGKLKFYNNRTGYGYITLDKPPSDVTGDLRVERSEVNFGGTKSGFPRIDSDIMVECGIWKNKKGALKAYNMTMKGGGAFTRENLEHRKLKGGGTYQGEVSLWNWKQGWGFIKPTNISAFPQAVTQALKKMTDEAAEKAKSKDKEPPTETNVYLRRVDLPPGTRLSKGDKVKFQVYTDDKGVGATNVQKVE